VREIIMDKEAMDDKYNHEEDVYFNEIKIRPYANEGLLAANAPDDEKATATLMNELKMHEQSNEQFTIVIVRIRREIAAQLLTNKKVLDVPADIAQVPLPSIPHPIPSFAAWVI
jgi:hypothetical protein